MSTLEDNPYFSRGKLARSRQCPREFYDLRVAPENRTAWREGWDEQDARERQRSEPAEERTERLAEQGRIWEIVHEHVLSRSNPVESGTELC